MRAIRVSLGERSYPIYLADSYRLLPHALRRAGLPPWGVVVSHASLLKRFGHELLAPLRRAGWRLDVITVQESERAKSWASAERVLRLLAARTAMRAPVLLAFGGGVVGDLTGFVAAIFRRGVPYVQLPTTLLAQVDSAIGGKVGVDLPEAKNAVGAFYQPRLVFSHLKLLRHLPRRQRRSGLSEIIKYAAIADPHLFAFLEERLPACLLGALRVDRVMVDRCSRIKARVVARDERDTRGIRAALNFGHTLGHALETATGYRRFTHGEAIAIGMACASQLSVRLGLLPAADHARLLRLLSRAELPTTAGGISRSAIRSALARDKKFVQGAMRWVLLRRIGKAVVSESVPNALMREVIGEYVT